MNVAKANYEDVVARYYDGTAAHVAADHLSELIAAADDASLARLLRDYREESVSDPREIELRAATDRLLACYSVLEIACMATFIAPIPDEFALKSGRILGNRHVRRYYEEFYPTKLPTLFRRRLGQKPHLDTDERAWRAMISFLELDRQFTERLEDRTLMRMLDSFTIAGFRFRDVVALIDVPEKFINHLLHGADTEETLAIAVNELGMFLQLCFDLRDVLARMAGVPRLQAAMWTYYGYWFDILGDELNTRLGDALGRFLKWRAPVGVVDEAGLEIQQYVGRAREVLRELTAGSFKRAADELL